MSTQNMIRGRSNVVTLTNNSGGGLVSGDVCIQDTSADEKATTTTSAASVLKIFIAAETIASGATGRFYESGYCPLVNVNASVTRGRFLFTHTVAKQAAENATYGSGAFGKILKSGTTPSAIIYSATAQISGSGAPTTAKYVTTATDAGLSAEIVIPGLAGSPDIAAGGVNDDEFDALSGWTTLGTLDTLNATDIPSHVHMKRANVAVHGDGIIKAIPTTPFTVTVKLTDAAIDINFNSAGIVLGEASPGKFLTFGPVFNNGWPGGVVNSWTNVSTLSGATNIAWANPSTWHYLRIVVANTTSAEYWVSWNGLVWKKVLAAANPGFTIGTVGVGMSDSSAATTNEAYFDWIRFT